MSCARHMFVLPCGGVDLQKGERYASYIYHHAGYRRDSISHRFANVDFAMISGLQRWLGLKLHVSAYDIQCQFRLNFLKRMKQNLSIFQTFPSLTSFRFPATIAAVGKFHLPAHKVSCRFKFSFNWLPWAGITDGEALERIWAALNALAIRTREMSYGHRHDVINNFHSFMNLKRTQDLRMYCIYFP